MAPALTISIPTATTATPVDAKPFTQYHVSLQLPLRRHDIRKRYNDFAALHEALLAFGAHKGEQINEQHVD